MIERFPRPVARVFELGRDWRVRVGVIGALLALCALLSFFPERHRAAVTLTPSDPQSLGLSGTLGQLGAINNVFGNQAAVEIALRVGDSIFVREKVIKATQLQQRLGKSDVTAVHRWLSDKVELRSLRGGIIMFEMIDRDGLLARDVVGAYATATRERLAEISRQQTAYKRGILVRLVKEAAADLAKAQRAYDAFRLRNRNPDPASSIDNVSQRIPQLEGAIKAKEIAIAATQALLAPDNSVLVQMRAELVALRQQLAAVRATNPASDTSVGQAVIQSSQLFKLERELNIQRSLYDSYLRYLQGTAVEDMTSTANVRILEPPYLDSERQLWWPAVIAGILLLLLWVGGEFLRVRLGAASARQPEVA